MNYEYMADTEDLDQCDLDDLVLRALKCARMSTRQGTGTYNIVSNYFALTVEFEDKHTFERFNRRFQWSNRAFLSKFGLLDPKLKLGFDWDEYIDRLFEQPE